MSNSGYSQPTPSHVPGSGKSPRQIYRERQAKRQMRVFGLLITVLLAILVVSMMMLSGMLPSVFGNDFSKKIVYAREGETPCPTERARPVPADGTEVQVLNASSLSGSAGDTANLLEKMGYTIALVDNATTPFRGNVQFDVGPGSVDAAYTMARYFHDPIRIKLRDMPPNTVSITIGEGFQGFLPKEERKAARESDARLRPLEECLPVSIDTVSQSPGIDQSGESS